MSQNNMKKPAALGRGLSALFGEASTDMPAMAPPPSVQTPDAPRSVTKVAVELLSASPYQPRRHFDDEALNALTASIAARGIIQPIVVRQHPIKDGQYEIIAGERRWRAAQRAGLHEVPVVVRDMEDREAMEVALIENIQRADLSPIEEAQAYQRLLEEFNHTQDALAKNVGKSRSHVANTMRLLNLPQDVQGLIRDGQISAGHARALLATSNPSKLAQEIIARGLTVRQIERIAKEGGTKPASKAEAAQPAIKDADILALERELSLKLGLIVKITATASGSGALSIQYQNLDQLEIVLNRLSTAG